MTTFHNPDGMWAPFGAFSMMALQGTGQIAHLKGQVSLNAEGEVVGPSDMALQVRQVLENIRTCLASAGGEMRDVLSLVHYTTDINAFMGCGETLAGVFQPPYPITTTVEVAALYDPRLVIEITAVAEIPRDRLIMPSPATTS